MILELLICTYGKGIEKIPELVIPSIHNVKYLISWQCGEIAQSNIPDSLKRDDINIVTCPGIGLSKNRNNALANATGDICLIADDDCKYKKSYFASILETFEGHPTIDIATFKMATTHKSYPSHSFDLRQPEKDYYVSSIEIAFRRNSVQDKLQFNELFGIGAPVLGACEESIFIYDALQLNMHCEYFPTIVVEHNHATTTSDTLSDSVIMAQGAYLYVTKTPKRFLRSIIMAKRINKKTNCGFFHAFKFLLKGISYIKKANTDK